MNICKPVSLSFWAAIILPFCLPAQQAPSSFAGSLARSSSAAVSAAVPSQSMSPSEEVMVANRARVFGDRVAADGTRYFCVTDSALHGKTSDQILQSLTPTAVSASDHVREMDVVIDLHHPLTVFANPNQSIYVGTVMVQGTNSTNIDVHASITTNGLTISPK